MYRKIKNNIEWLEFEQLSEFPELVHGIFLRKGGESVPPFHFLNVSMKTQDDPQVVAKNRERIFFILGLQKVISPNICHGSNVEIVESEKKLDRPCDGLITKTRDLGLFITHADCQVAIFYDPIKKIVGNIHCGWRGNVQNIYGKTVACFQKHYGSNPKDLLVCISPSLGPDAAQFVNYQTELPPNFYRFQVRPYYFDFWEISKNQLLEAKVGEGHIEIAKICTYQNENDFFSYRREKKTGRNATLVAMREI